MINYIKNFFYNKMKLINKSRVEITSTFFAAKYRYWRYFLFFFINIKAEPASNGWKYRKYLSKEFLRSWIRYSLGALQTKRNVTICYNILPSDCYAKGDRHRAIVSKVNLYCLCASTLLSRPNIPRVGWMCNGTALFLGWLLNSRLR